LIEGLKQRQDWTWEKKGQEVEIEVFDKKKDLIAKIPSELVQDFLDVQHFGKSWRSSLFGAK